MAGCATNSCAGYRKLDASPKDTPDTKREVLANNIYGERMGCTMTQQDATRGPAAGVGGFSFKMPSF